MATVDFTTHKANIVPFSVPESWGVTRQVKEYGDTCFTAQWDVQMWNKESGRITSFEGHLGEVVAFKFRRELNALFTGSRDNTAKMWDIETGKCRVTYTGHTGPVLTIKYLGERLLISDTRLQITGKRLYTGSQDGTVKIWDPLTGECLQTFAGKHGAVLAMKVKSNRLFTLAFSGVAMWDIDSGKCLRSYKIRQELSALEVTDNLVIVGTFAGHIYLFDKESDEVKQTLFGRLSSYHPDQLTEITALKAAGHNLFAADSSGKVKWFNLKKIASAIVCNLETENMCTQLKWSDEQSRLEARIGPRRAVVVFNS